MVRYAPGFLFHLTIVAKRFLGRKQDTETIIMSVSLQQMKRIMHFKSCSYALYCLPYGTTHGYTSVLDMNTAQDGAKIWDKIHHEGKCVKLLWSSSGAKTELI